MSGISNRTDSYNNTIVRIWLDAVERENPENQPEIHHRQMRLTDTDRYTQIQSIEHIAPWNTLQRILGNRQDIDSIAAQNYHTGDNGN